MDGDIGVVGRSVSPVRSLKSSTRAAKRIDATDSRPTKFLRMVELLSLSMGREGEGKKGREGGRRGGRIEESWW